MRLLSIIVLFLLSYGCRQAIPDRIIVNARVRNLPEGKIYLSNAYFKHQVLDSAICKNDTFSFNFAPKAGFEPFMASLWFLNKDGLTEPLIFNSGDILAPNKKPFSIDGFMLERGVTDIGGTYTGFSPFPNLKVSPLNIRAGRQNEVLFRMNFSNFAVPSGDRARVLQSDEVAIRKYPYSYYLLDQLDNNKEAYSKEELERMLGLFDADMSRTTTMTRLRTFMNERVSTGTAFSNAALLDARGSTDSLLEPGARLQLLVFWASWCGPCRMEIPELKKIYAQFGNRKEFNMVSISIDADKDKWQQALAQENMPWKQLWADSTHIKNEFGIGSIPALLFLDGNRKEIARFVGYSKENQLKWRAIIEARAMGS